MKASLLSLALCGLVAASVGASEAESEAKSKQDAGGKQLDPWELKALHFYLVGDLDGKKACYEVSGARIARGKDGSGDTSAECKENWKEEADLGNFDGYKDPKRGSHFSGGSRRGCSTWLKYFADEAADEVGIEVTEDVEDGACDTFIVLTGPPSAFDEGKDTKAIEKVMAKEEKSKEADATESEKESSKDEVVTDKFAAGSLRSSTVDTTKSSQGGVLMPVVGGAAVVVAIIAVTFLVRRKTDSSNAAE